jgi:hypothetical protein
MRELAGNGHGFVLIEPFGREYLGGVVIDWSNLDAAFLPNFSTDSLLDRFRWLEKSGETRVETGWKTLLSPHQSLRAVF